MSSQFKDQFSKLNFGEENLISSLRPWLTLSMAATSSSRVTYLIEQTNEKIMKYIFFGKYELYYALSIWPDITIAYCLKN